MLSVCIIAKNEEAVLEACLQSVAGIATEIILLDTGSTDATLAIAEKYNCRIYHYTWDGKFTRARNTACAYASYEWIFCIDCDERLRNPERALAAMQSAPADVGCIITERHNHAIAKDGERSNERRGNARLFRNTPAIRWAFEVHEETWSTCTESGLALQHSDVILDHDVWRPGYAGFIKKQQYYDGLLNQCLKTDYAQHYLFHLAKNQMLFENYSNALALFDKAEQGNKYSVHNDAFLKCYKGYSAFMQKDMALAERSFMQAQELIPGLSTANFYLIEFYMRQAKFKEALHCAEHLILTGAAVKPLTVADMYFSPIQVNYRKAFITLQTGNMDAAAELLAHENYTAESSRSLALLSKIELMKGNKKKSLAWLNEALVYNPGWTYISNLKKAQS